VIKSDTKGGTISVPQPMPLLGQQQHPFAFFRSFWARLLMRMRLQQLKLHATEVLPTHAQTV
jgi:hypothetical protein